jgi:hypothetical protein
VTRLTIYIQTFYVAVATAGLSIAGSALIPWFSVKKSAPKPSNDPEFSNHELNTKNNQPCDAEKVI